MGTKEYGQLSLEERIEIYRLHADGKSCRFIANLLRRSASTISRELERNSHERKNWEGGYDPARAQRLTERRRGRGRSYKLECQPELRQLVFDQLAMGRSPEQIAGRLTLEQGKPVISHESIYRYIYWRKHSFGEPVHRLLPRGKYRRGWYRRGQKLTKNYIARRVSVHERPAGAENRARFGHWEADLMGFSKGQVLVVHERKSRFTAVLLQPAKKSEDVISSLRGFFRVMPRKKRRSVTFDNGGEFSRHYELTDCYGMKTWFCDTHSPWQKGGIENAIGRLRRFLPRKTKCQTLTKITLARLTDISNNAPRKCLGYKTPNEVFWGIKSSVALQT